MELKNCPFCGGEARLEHMGYPHHVFCVKCYSRTIGRGMEKDGELSAITAWNTRQPRFTQEEKDALEFLRYVADYMLNTEDKPKYQKRATDASETIRAMIKESEEE
jgi:hypothetical protein